MKFDVIIATYNRRDSLKILVEQILECSCLPEKIIIVDSSIDENQEIQSLDSVTYVRSSHKNQPYQRYVGYLASSSDVLIYFDDDMRIVDKQCFEKILIPFNDENVVGVQPNFIYKNNFYDCQIPESKIRQLAQNNIFFKFLKTLSGNPSIEDGKLWLAGIRGRSPDNGKSLEWFNGPVFSARKKYLYNNFNFNLFELYKKRVGKAEDVILGFTLSKLGKVIYLEDAYFYHDDQNDSVYSVNFISYSERISCSRLYLSFEYARLSGKSKVLAFFHYHLFILGRIGCLIANQFINFERSRFNIMLGYLRGYFKALLSIKTLISFDNGFNEKKEALNDLSENPKFIRNPNDK